MQQFKVGDWLENIRSVNQRIIKQVVDCKEHLDTLTVGNPTNGVNVILKSDITLWQPKQGEWCWFYDSCNPQVTPVLAQFDYMSENIYVTKAIELPLSGEGPYPYGFNSCIPFIGTLPDIPKDTQ